MSNNTIDIAKLPVNNQGVTIFSFTDNQNPISQIIRGVAKEERVILTHEDPIEDAYDSIKREDSLASVASDRSNPAVVAKDDVTAESFSEANRAAMRRLPETVILGIIDGEDKVAAAIDLALQGVKVIATVKSKDIGAIIPDILSFLPTELRASKACELISNTNMLVTKKATEAGIDEEFVAMQHLVFDKALKTKLLASIEDKGYNPETLSQEIESTAKEVG